MEQTVSDDEILRSGVLRTTIYWLGAAVVIALSAFQLYTAYFGPLTALQQRAIHLSGMMAALFLLTALAVPMARSIVAVGFAALATLPALYIYLNYTSIILTAGLVTDVQVALGILTLIIVLVTTKIVIGWPLVIIAIISILYALFGNVLPPPIGHSGYKLERVVGHLFVTTEGVFSTPMAASATYIFVFIFFGALLKKTGMGDVFIGLGHALTGKRRGGPAFVAVISSALFGSINGSAVANVSSTGTFTIPLMRKAGYDRQTSAAIEAAASSGGQIMPPIMGASAFVMVQLTGIPYLEITSRALVPALLYFAAVLTAVHLFAQRADVKAVSVEDLPNFTELLLKRGYMLLPIPVLIYFLIDGYTPYRAGFYCIVGVIALSMLRADTRLTPGRFLDVCKDATRSAMPVATACACAGIVIGILTLTGLGLKLSSLIVAASGGYLFVALVLTALASIVLGMGLPTVGVYLLLAVLVAPALEQMGVPLLAAHLFIFYYGLVSAITPPVALAAYAAAAIAGSKPLETSIQAFLFGLAKVIVPFMFVYGPELLLMGDTMAIAIAVATSFLGIYALGMATAGWWRGPLSTWRRVLIGVAALGLIHPSLAADLVAATVIVAASLAGRSLRKPRAIT